MEKYKTTRIWAHTLSKLRMIAAMTNTSIVKVIDRLADEELKRLKEKGQEQCYCAVLAKESPFATRLNSQARQASADRAWFALSRFYENCKVHKPGKKGYPKFQHDNRSVEVRRFGAYQMAF
jgi:transposase